MTISGGGARGLAASLILLATAAPTVALASPQTPATSTLPAEATAPSPARDEDGLAVRLNDLSPAVISQGEATTVGVTLTNTTEQPLEALEVSVQVQSAIPISRFALRSWISTPRAWATTQVLAQSLPGTLAPGESRPVRLEIPADQLPPLTSWGPRGVQVRATGTRVSDARSPEASTAADATAEGAARSWLVFDAPEGTVPLPYSVVVPLTPTAQELDAAVTADRPAATLTADAAPRLESAARRLTAPGVTLAMDPALLTQSAPENSADPAVAKVTASAAQATASLTTTLRAAAAGEREVVLLPSGDPDVAALAHSSHPEFLQQSVDLARQSAEALDFPARTDVLLPGGSVLDGTTVGVATRGGLTAVAGSGTLAPTSGAVTWTPSSRADLAANPDDSSTAVPALLGDTELAQVAAGVLVEDGRASATQVSDTKALDPLESRQLLLAETAVIQRERPNDPRVLGLVLDRSVTANEGSLDNLATSLDALAQASWLQPRTLSTVLRTPADGPARTTLPTSQTVSGEATPALVADLAGLLRDVQQVAVSTSDPNALYLPARQRVHLLLAQGWRGDVEGRAAAAQQVHQTMAGTRDQVLIAPSSTINLLATSAELPVRVTNALPVAVTAQVHLDPPDGRLSAREAATVTVPAHGEATALVSVQAVGSGNLELAAHLTTTEGVPLGDPAVIDVRLRADWEGRGAVIGGVILSLVLVVGIVRTVRRTRRRADEAEGPVD